MIQTTQHFACFRNAIFPELPSPSNSICTAQQMPHPHSGHGSIARVICAHKFIMYLIYVVNIFHFEMLFFCLHDTLNAISICSKVINYFINARLCALPEPKRGLASLSGNQKQLNMSKVKCDGNFAVAFFPSSQLVTSPHRKCLSLKSQNRFDFNN